MAQRTVYSAGGFHAVYVAQAEVACVLYGIVGRPQAKAVAIISKPQTEHTKEKIAKNGTKIKERWLPAHQRESASLYLIAYLVS